MWRSFIILFIFLISHCTSYRGKGKARKLGERFQFLLFVFVLGYFWYYYYLKEEEEKDGEGEGNLGSDDNSKKSNLGSKWSGEFSFYVF